MDGCFDDSGENRYCVVVFSDFLIRANCGLYIRIPFFSGVTGISRIFEITISSTSPRHIITISPWPGFTSISIGSSHAFCSLVSSMLARYSNSFLLKRWVLPSLQAILGYSSLNKSDSGFCLHGKWAFNTLSSPLKHS